MDSRTTLIATLGGQPQKVTFLLDLLLARGEEIREVTLVFISSYIRTQNALEMLAKEFAGDLYLGRPCRLILHPVRSGGADLLDIRTAEEVEAARKNIQELIHRLKAERVRKEGLLHAPLDSGVHLLPVPFPDV